MDDVVAALERALAGLVDAVSGVAMGWLVLGVALHLANQLARGRGWHSVVRRACTEDETPRRRDVVAAWVAGAGAGGVVSARGGDAVRVLVLSRKMPGKGSGALLTGTLVAETVGGDRAERGRDRARAGHRRRAGRRPDADRPGSTCCPACSPWWACCSSDAAARVCAGSSRAPPAAVPLLRYPRRYAREVLPWQALSRVLRLLALACFLAAFGLPATPAAVLLVVFAQSTGRLVPFSPASVGAGAAILAATFEPVTGTAVPVSQVTAFFFGTSTVLTVVGTVLALAICIRVRLRPRRRPGRACCQCAPAA